MSHLQIPRAGARCPSLISSLARPQTKDTLRRPATTPRPFSTTACLQTKTVRPHRLAIPQMPPYPYGERTLYKQSNRGLYGEARIRFGNTIAPKYKNKSRRFWRPNVQERSLYSPSLRANIRTRLTMRVFRTIEREGGIENYILKPKGQRVKELGPSGWALRWLLMQSKAVQIKFNEQRVTLGLPEKEVVDNEDLIEYVLDQATPGKLSLRSRATLEQLKQMDAVKQEIQDGITLDGEEVTEDIKAVEEAALEEEPVEGEPPSEPRAS